MMVMKNFTNINNFIAIWNFELLFGNGDGFPVGMVVSVRFVHVDDVLAQLCHGFLYTLF